MATIFVIDLERRICIARGSNVEVLAKFADLKSGPSYTGNLNDVIGALKVDELTDLYNNHCGDLELPPRDKKFAKKFDAKKALKNVLASANIAEPKNGGRKKASKKKQPQRGRNRATNGARKLFRNLCSIFMGRPSVLLPVFSNEKGGLEPAFEGDVFSCS